MGEKSKLLLCYNLGCGQQFNPNENGPESCRHHAGVPVFHDAYKGWSCCKKKCTDFTEFLNIKGCVVSCHSNVKPEPEKQKEKSSNDVIEFKAPQTPMKPTIPRPSCDTPLTLLKPVVSPRLVEELQNLKTNTNEVFIEFNGKGSIPVGTTCKNNSCNMTYEGSETLNTRCTYHPGYPVFHEGLKFWSCCTKRTTDFNTFLQQIGCTIGDHVWFKTVIAGEVKCRLDWHQTGTFVFVTVFGKKCDPEASVVQLSPVRLKISLSFPEQGGVFNKDMELMRVIDVQESSISMYPSKIEIKLKKLEAGTWSKLEIQKTVKEFSSSNTNDVKNLPSDMEAVDLSCI